jgi:hypothetical protein
MARDLPQPIEHVKPQIGNVWRKLAKAQALKVAAAFGTAVTEMH